eukprot:scaffold154358_cov21-Tisochrysis_lutea.AAC.4
MDHATEGVSIARGGVVVRHAGWGTTKQAGTVRIEDPQVCVYVCVCARAQGRVRPVLMQRMGHHAWAFSFSTLEERLIGRHAAGPHTKQAGRPGTEETFANIRLQHICPFGRTLWKGLMEGNPARFARADHMHCCHRHQPLPEGSQCCCRSSCCLKPPCCSNALVAQPDCRHCCHMHQALDPSIRTFTD